MARTTVVRLTGEDLTPTDVWKVAVEGAGAELDESVREKMAASRAVVERALLAEGPTYGVTTGFGRFVSRSVPRELVEELQLRLLRSHACGVGEPYPDEVVRAAILMRANALARAADIACALSVDALQASRESFLPRIHELRPLRGQAASAANVLSLLEGSGIVEAHRWCDRVQDAYSLRCAPQVHGASRDLLDYVEYTTQAELNAATDNPLVLAEDETMLLNGNFHGQPLGFALDVLAMAASELASISERRIERLVNPALSEGLPAFLAPDGGLNSGFMIPQYVAASLVSENKALCHPASVDSIPTSAGQEDHVAMGNASGLKAWQVLANAERVLAIELLAGAQAVEFHAPLEPGVGGRAAHGLVRSVSPRLGDDRALADDIEAVAAVIRDGSALAAVEAEVGELA